MKITAIIGFLLVLSVVAVGKDEPDPPELSAEVMESGVYAIRRIGTIRDENMPGEQWHVGRQFMLVSATNRIPASVGLTFGFRCKIKGETKGKQVFIRAVHLFPEAGLQDPKADRPKTRSEYKSPAVVGAEMLPTYTFDHEWELVPGKWIIQMWHQDKKLAEKTFDVYLPEKKAPVKNQASQDRSGELKAPKAKSRAAES